MGDVDKLQIAEEAAGQRAEQQAAERRERDASQLRAAPLRATADRARSATLLRLDQLHPGDNIRLDLPEIHDLARSIREVGLLTPLLVRPWVNVPTADGPVPSTADASLPQYRLVAGHRRHAALTALLEAEVPGFDGAQIACEVREGLTEAESYALMLTENVQRVPLEPIQAARALRLLLDLNEGIDAASLARSLGLRPAWAQTHLKLLDLPAEVQERIEAGDLSVTIADLLRRGQAAGRIDEGRMVDLARQIASGEITTAQARTVAGPPPRNTPPPRTERPGDPSAPADRPVSPEARWDSTVRGEDVVDRAAAAPRHNPYATTSADAPNDASAPQDTYVPLEDRLDIYLLGRALEEWATDEYLDELGIDRTQTALYAGALEFEERIAGIRHLSSALMNASRVLEPAS